MRVYLNTNIYCRQAGGQSKNYAEIKYESLLKTAYQSRPDWKSFQAGKKIAEDTVGLYTSGYLPSIMYVQSAGRSVSQYPTSGARYDLELAYAKINKVL